MKIFIVAFIQALIGNLTLLLLFEWPPNTGIGTMVGLFTGMLCLFFLQNYFFITNFNN